MVHTAPLILYCTCCTFNIFHLWQKQLKFPFKSIFLQISHVKAQIHFITDDKPISCDIIRTPLSPTGQGAELKLCCLGSAHLWIFYSATQRRSDMRKTCLNPPEKGELFLFKNVLQKNTANKNILSLKIRNSPERLKGKFIMLWPYLNACRHFLLKIF